MRAAVVAAVLAGAGLLVSHALADSVPVPTLPTVTAPTPPVQITVPLPAITTIPTIPQPVVTAPTSVETPTVGTPALPSVQSPSGSVAGSTINGGSQASSGSSASSSSPSRLRSSGTWVSTTGPKQRRFRAVTFVLTHDARVVFVVRQVSPTCRVAGRFTVNGHAGRNRIRIPKRLSRRLLQPGTYRIYAHTAAGRLVRRVTLVVVAGGTPSAAELAAARAANVCATTARLASATSANVTPGSGTPVASGGLPSASPPVQSENTGPGAVLGTSVERAARAIQPVVIALLALAILLLGVASVPPLAAPHSRANHILASHRVELAGLGAAAFIAVIVAFLLG
jgi:hypothetical protein